MTSPDIRQKLYLLLLVAALVAVLWLANTLDRSALPERGGLVFSPPAGTYDHSLLLEIHPSRPGASIIFTTNGAEPTTTVGTLYERPLRLDSDAPGVTVVRAREYLDGVPGPVQSASYVVGLEHTLPVLSIIADVADLWDPQGGILANTWQRGQDWERTVHVTFIEGGHRQSFDVSAGLRVDGSEPFERFKQSFQLYFRQEYGAPRLEYPLFPHHQQDIQSYKRLLLQAGEKSGRWTLLEEQLLSDITADVGGHATQGRYVLLFINGEPWGVYRLSERIDRFFLQDHYALQSVDLIQGGQVEEGDGRNWDALMHWLETRDLNDADNYAYLQTQIDLASFTDAVILRAFFGLPGDDWWAARSQAQDGRWFWFLGGGFGEAKLTQGAGRVLLRAPSDDPDDLNLLLRKLLENPSYRARFARRAADLLNTSLSPPALDAHIDRLAAKLRPDIGYELDRWPTALGGSELQPFEQDGAQPAHLAWERNVIELREFVRQSPDALRRQIEGEFGLRGTATLTFNLSGGRGGYVVANESPLLDLPWSGSYFLDTELRVIAVPEPDFVFAGWESDSVQTSLPLITLTVDGPQSFTARFAAVRADDLGLRPNDVIINEYWINDDGSRYSSAGGHSIEGDWFELLVTRPRAIDLRGWRITDNDTKTATSEGSIIIPSLETFAAVPRNTVILIIATESDANDIQFRGDDLDPSDGQMVLYVGNGYLDVMTDPGFNIGTGDDNLALLAPGPSSTPADDVGIDFVAEGDAVTPLSFGILVDGVTFGEPFQGLGRDDGALFTGKTNNDSGAVGWIVDPAPEQSGDDVRPGIPNVVTPGGANYGQNDLSIPAIVVWLALVGSVGAALVLFSRTRHNRAGQ